MSRRAVCEKRKYGSVGGARGDSGAYPIQQTAGRAEVMPPPHRCRLPIRATVSMSLIQRARASWGKRKPMSFPTVSSGVECSRAAQKRESVEA